MKFDAGTQTISWFQKEFREGTLALRPPYQRKPVWAARQKCYLIESILYGMPIPEIFVHETTSPDGQTLHAIVDGQQRIRAVLQFLGLTTLTPEGLPETDEEEFAGFALDTFDKKAAVSPWLGQRFVDLADDEKVKFFEYKFHVRYLRDASETDLRGMFTRLNRFLTALNPQELRHAIYTGPFAKLAERLAENEYWLASGLVSRALIRRLGDVEFVSQLLIGVVHGPQGGSAGVIDEHYRLNEDYDLDEGFPEQGRATKLFEATLKLVQRIFPDLQRNAELRWGNRTDFYSFFVAAAEFMREHETPRDSAIPKLRKALEAFSRGVNRRLADEDSPATGPIIEYVRAVEKGANDKARRADRHRILVALFEKVLNVNALRRAKATTTNRRVSKKR